MTRYIRFILRFRWPVIVFFLLVTLFFGFFLSKASLKSSVAELFFSNNPLYERYLERVDQFGGDAIALVGISGSDLAGPDSTGRLRDAIDEIEAMEMVERTESMVSAQHIQGRGDLLEINDYFDLLQDEPARKQELLGEITTDPLTRDWLVTPDGRHTVVLVEFPSIDEAWSVGPEVVESILAAFESRGFAARDINRGGLAVVGAECLNQGLFSVKRILPITAVILFLTVFILFRRLWPMILTMFITGLAIVWTMGLAVILFGHLNIFSTMIPTLVLIICFADVIHLCSSFLIELSLGKTRDEAVFAMGKEVGTACGYTSITTFFGFISMTLVPAPVFKQMGILMGFGVSVALFLAMTLVPIFLSFIAAPRPWRLSGKSIVQNMLDRSLTWTDEFVKRRALAVFLFFCLAFALCLWGASQMIIETRFSKRFGPSSPITQGVNFFNEHFPGTNPLDVYLTAEGPDGFLDPERFARAARLEARIETLGPVRQVVSVVDLCTKMMRELNPEMAGENPLPRTREEIAQLLLLFEMSGGENLDRLLSPDRKTMRLTARLPDMGVIETYGLAEKIQKIAKDSLPPDIGAETISFNFLLGEWLDELVAGQISGLAFALATIAALMIIALRSFKIGLLSMLPNVLPLLSLLAWAGFFLDSLDSDAMGVLMVAIGIGVDDTIHFLMRLKFESQKSPDPARAVTQTLYYSGRAIIISSIILVVGFSPFALSDYFSVEIFGTMLPACLIVALLADLFWVPAMVHLGIIRFKKPKTG